MQGLMHDIFAGKHRAQGRAYVVGHALRSVKQGELVVPVPVEDAREFTLEVIHVITEFHDRDDLLDLVTY
jgi:hypothetical protein